MDQSEDREEGVPPSKTTLSGEHENQTRDQRTENEFTAMKEVLIVAVQQGMDDELMMTDYNELNQKPYPYHQPCPPWYPPVRPVSFGSRPEPSLESGSKQEPKLNPAERPVTEFKRPIFPDVNQVLKQKTVQHLINTDCIEKQPQYETTGTSEKKRKSLYPDEWYPLVRPVSAGSRPESPLESGSERESQVNPAERPVTEFKGPIFPSSWKDLTQSDWRKEPPKYETIETHDKRMDNKLSNMTDRMKEHEDAVMTHMKLMEDKLSDMAERMKGREDAKMAHITSLMDNKLSNMTERMKEHEDTMMMHMKLTENKLSNMAERMKGREDAKMAHMKLIENKLSNMTDMMKEREDTKMAYFTLMEDKLNFMTDRMKEREDTKMAHIKLMENKLSNMVNWMKQHEDTMMMKLDQKFDEFKRQLLCECKEELSPDCESVSSCVSFKSDRSMKHSVDFKDSRPSAPKRRKQTNIKPDGREKRPEYETTGTSKKRKRKLEEEGSDSTEPEPREEPSSPSDSDGKSSCVSFNSDRSLKRLTHFKGSGPSAPKRKPLED